MIADTVSIDQSSETARFSEKEMFSDEVGSHVRMDCKQKGVAITPVSDQSAAMRSRMPYSSATAGLESHVDVKIKMCLFVSS